MTKECTNSQQQSGLWFAIYVKPRHEKVIAHLLESRGYDQFTPFYERKNHKRIVQWPVLPGYVLCRFDPNNRLPILSLPGVFFIVRAGEKLARIDDAEIRALQASVGSGCTVAPCPYIHEGQKVSFTAGPLYGLNGFYKGPCRDEVVVSITLLNRSVAVKVQPGWLAPVRYESSSR